SGHAVAVAPQGHGSRKAETHPRPIEAGAIFANVNLVPGAGIVEGGPALQPEGEPPADHADSADQLIRRRAGVAQPHVVLHFAHAVAVLETRDQDVGVRPIELLAADRLASRGDAETAPLAIIQNGGENAR